MKSKTVARDELRERKAELVGFCIGSLVVAVLWPLIYPGLDFLLALIGFGEKPGPWAFLREFGPLYGRDPDAPGFFRGMAEASQEISGEHPALVGLPYMTKSGLLASVVYPLYMVEALLFVMVSGLALVSRAMAKPIRSLLEGIAVTLAALPLVAILLFWLAFILLAYIQALSAGFFMFVFQIVLLPAVLLRVTSATFGVFLLACWFVPVGLAFAGRDGFARRVPIALLPE
jgi:hypothetical protein